MQYSRARQVITNISLKSKLLSLVILVLVCVLSYSYVSIRIVRDKYNEVYYHTLADALSLCIDAISEQILTYEDAAKSFIVSDVIQNTLSNYKDNAKFLRSTVYTDIYQRLNRLANSLHSINNVALVLDESSIVYSKNLKNPLDEVMLERAKILGDSQIGGIWETGNSSTGHLLYIMSIRRMDGLKLDSLATLVIDVDVGDLFESSKKLQTITNYGFVMYDDRNRTVFNNLEFKVDYDKIISSSAHKKYSIQKAVNDEYYFTILGNDHNWYYVCMASYTELMDWIVGLLRVLNFIAILLIIFTLVASRCLLKKILFHFNSLRLKFLAFAGVSVDIPEYDYQGRTDELGVLHQQFDSMRERITVLMQKNIKQMLDIKKVQIDMLQSQINPHFILNSLHLLDWRVKKLKDKQLNIMIESLGKIIQISLSGKERLILLDTEIDLIREYIKIQQFRNPNLFIQLKVEFDDALMEYKIPKLSIQPLIENAFLYSDYSHSNTISITIKAYKHDDSVMISVSNSGSVFEKALLQKLRIGEVKTTGHGIGLVNIDKRIKYTYSNDYGLSLVNHGGLATVILTLPFYTGDAKNV